MPARPELAHLVPHLDASRAAVHEVQLVLRVVVVVEALVLRRIDDGVDAERRDAERAAHLAEAEAVAELVDRSERVAHGETLTAQVAAVIVMPPRAFCSSVTCTFVVRQLERLGDVVADPHRERLAERAFVAEPAEVDLQRLRLEAERAPARTRSSPM